MGPPDTYLLESDLSVDQRYLTSEQPGPEVFSGNDLAYFVGFFFIEFLFLLQVLSRLSQWTTTDSSTSASKNQTLYRTVYTLHSKEIPKANFDSNRKPCLVFVKYCKTNSWMSLLQKKFHWNRYHHIIGFLLLSLKSYNYFYFPSGITRVPVFLNLNRKSCKIFHLAFFLLLKHELHF